MNRRLAIYLNDHLAGSVVGTELAKRALRENRGTAFEEPLSWLLVQIQEDRATLVKILEELGVSRSRVKSAVALVFERLGRLKLNGQLTGYSPLSRVVELEGLTLGITGKLGLWESLRELSPDEPRLRGFDFDELARRAREQLDRLREQRLAASRLGLKGSGTEA